MQAQIPNEQKPVHLADNENLQSGPSGDNLTPAPDFEPGDVSDIYEKLSTHSHALKAFGALLKSSNLQDFADITCDGDHNPQNHASIDLRWGLQQIIDLYLSCQENILSEHLEQYKESDAMLIKWARGTIRDIEQGCYVLAPNQGGELLIEAVKKLDVVEGRQGDLAETAKKLKVLCSHCIDQLEGKATARA